MHYYKHYIGDYRRDTSHLSLLEHGIYRQLIDSYCLDEVPLTNDLAKLMRSHSVRTPDEQQALQNVLTDFFELTENGYIHKRCEKTIAEYHGKSDKARQSANARWHKENNELQSNNANALQTHTEGNANHKPITINQEPLTNKKLKPNAEALDGFSEFWAIYDKKVEKPQAEKSWKRIKPSIELQLTIYDAARKYVQATPDKKYRKNPSTWLNNQCWNDEVVTETQQKKVGFFGTLMNFGDSQNEQLPIAIASRLDG